MGKYSVRAAVTFDLAYYSLASTVDCPVGCPGGNEGGSRRAPSHHPSSPVRPSIAGATPAAFSLFAPGRDWLAARMEHMAFLPSSPRRQWHRTAPCGLP